MTEMTRPGHVPASATADGDGIVLGSGPITVDAYIDFLCLQSGRYLDWPPYVTALATARGVRATPTVLVNGVPVPASKRMISAAVADS